MAATLQQWDLLNKKGRVVGIAESDNHDSLKGIGRFRVSVFPFAKAFKYLRTHVLTEKPLAGDAGMDITLLLSSLKRGRVYMAQESHCSARGFSFYIEECSRMATIGDEFIINKSAEIRINLPSKARITLLRNGVSVHEVEADETNFCVEKIGLYRVEVRKKIWGRYRPWIFSNPIYVK
jgi:hypothetical protein